MYWILYRITEDVHAIRAGFRNEEWDFYDKDEAYIKWKAIKRLEEVILILKGGYHMGLYDYVEGNCPNCNCLLQNIQTKVLMNKPCILTIKIGDRIDHEDGMIRFADLCQNCGTMLAAVIKDNILVDLVVCDEQIPSPDRDRRDALIAFAKDLFRINSD